MDKEYDKRIKTLETVVQDAVRTRLANTRNSNKKNEMSINKSPIKEIVKEKKVKKDIPQRAKNDPRQKD